MCLGCGLDFWSSHHKQKCDECGGTSHLRLRKEKTTNISDVVFDRLVKHLTRRMGSTTKARERLKKWNLVAEAKKPRKPHKRGFSYERLGFATYEAYLASDLWGNIRERVLARDVWTCRLCGTAAEVVHHQDYSLETMRGRDITQLFSLCRPCHHSIEFDGDKKRTHSAAKDALVRRLPV